MVRNVFYETLPLLCLAFLWALAWAYALQARVSRNLAPRCTDNTSFIQATGGQGVQLTSADARD